MAMRSEASMTAFFEGVRTSRHRVLLTDFDGTLAPFQAARGTVALFAGVRERLARLAEQNRTRLVVVSGRLAAEVDALLCLPRPIEIWGDHGWERRLPSGVATSVPVPGDAADALAEVRRISTFASLDDVIEAKPAGIAFHWRGLPPGPATVVREWAQGFHDACVRGVLELVEFDGGMELRVPGRTKGDAVRAVLGDYEGETVAAAYLGDDMADEEAFRAIQGRGLGVLVRSDLRPTAAEGWLRPPKDLLGFLDRWHDACREG